MKDNARLNVTSMTSVTGFSIIELYARARLRDQAEKAVTVVTVVTCRLFPSWPDLPDLPENSDRVQGALPRRPFGAFLMRQPAHQRDRCYAPRGMRVEAAADWIGVGVTKFREMVADGRMPSGKLVDGCRVWDRFALDEAFDALPDEDGASEAGWGAVA